VKIAQVCPRYHPHIGGVETHVREISERMAKRGFEVEVLTTDPSKKLRKEDIVNDVRVMRFETWAPNEAYYLSRKLKEYLKTNSVDYNVVHAHSYHAFPALYAAQAKSGNQLVFSPHFHGEGHTFFRNLLHIPYRFLGKTIFRKADKIVCVSNFERSLITDHFKIGEEKIAVIPNGVNLKEFTGLERERKDYRAILYVGRLEKYKGAHYLVKALPELDNDIILEIVGKGPYKKELIKLVSRLNVERRVRFFQDLSRKELLQKYVDADLFVLLSKHEAYGICVAEALACGTPCVVADTSALVEWIDNENCFGINDPSDVNELVNLVNNVIGKNAKGLRLPDWNEVAEKLVRLYEYS